MFCASPDTVNPKNGTVMDAQLLDASHKRVVGAALNFSAASVTCGTQTSTLTVTDGLMLGLSATSTIVMPTPDNYSLTMSADMFMLLPYHSSNVQLLLMDSSTNTPVPNATITLYDSNGNYSGTITTLSDGSATTSFVIGTQSDTLNATVTTDSDMRANGSNANGTQADPISFSVAGAPAYTLSFSPVDTTLQQGQSVGIGVTLADQNGNGVSGASVSFYDEASGTSSTATMDANGGAGTSVTFCSDIVNATAQFWNNDYYQWITTTASITLTPTPPPPAPYLCDCGCPSICTAATNCVGPSNDASGNGSCQPCACGCLTDSTKPTKCANKTGCDGSGSCNCKCGGDICACTSPNACGGDATQCTTPPPPADPILDATQAMPLSAPRWRSVTRSLTYWDNTPKDPNWPTYVTNLNDPFVIGTLGPLGVTVPLTQLDQTLAATIAFPATPPVYSDIGEISGAAYFGYSGVASYSDPMVYLSEAMISHSRFWLEANITSYPLTLSLSYTVTRTIDGTASTPEVYSVPVTVPAGQRFSEPVDIIAPLLQDQIEDGNSHLEVVTITPITIDIIQPVLTKTYDLLNNVQGESVQKDEDGNDVLTPVSTVRFCRWTDAFPGDTFDPSFFTADRDRFQIRIQGYIPGLTKVMVSSPTPLKTVSGGQYLEKTNGDGPIEVAISFEDGYMVSDPILLVSDADDDVPFGAGLDGTPSKTLQAHFGSQIKMQFPELNNAIYQSQTAKPLGRVKLNIAYCSLDGSLTQDTKDLIVLQILKAKEAYRQIGVELVVTAIWPLTLSSDFAGDLGSNNQLNAGASEKLRNFVLNQTQNPIPSDQILVSFIDASLKAFSYNMITQFPVAGFCDNYSSPAVISINTVLKNDSRHFTMAHEAGHILTKQGHPDGDPQERLMVDGLHILYKHDYKDSKRLILSEDIQIMNNALNHYYVPLKKHDSNFVKSLYRTDNLRPLLFAC